MATQLVVCAVDGAAWAFPIGAVREIIRAVPAQPVGSLDRTALGIIDLRGVAMPVHDLAATLGLCDPWQRGEDVVLDAQQLASRRIVVTAADDGDQLVGWLVDGVDEVIEIAEGAVDAVVGGGSAFVVAIAHVDGNRLVPVLAVDRLLGAPGGADVQAA